MKTTVFWLLLALPFFAVAQVGINTTTPSSAAVLEGKSSADNTNFGGLLPPRVTLTQRNAIPVAASDDGMLIFLTNGTTRCLQIYNASANVWESIHCLNAAPVASAVIFTGTQTAGQTLTGSFTYSDVEGDPAGTHSYRWHRADSNTGLSAIAIPGATASTYTLADADIAKFIAFEATPVAAAGTSPGLAVRSNYSGAIAPRPTVISFVQQNQSKAENAASTAINLTFSFPNVSSSPVSVAVASNSYTRLTQNAARTIVIPVGTPSPYTTTVFNVQNNTLDDNDAVLTFTITNVDDEITLTFTENFTHFTGTGFAANPAAGQLYSDIWRVAVPTSMPWSSTQTALAFAHGQSNGNVANTVANIGVWAYNAAGNRCLGFKPGGEFFSGGIYLRVQNTTGVTLTNWTVSYTVRVYNTTAAGAITFGLLRSTTDSGYVEVPGTAPNFATAPNNAWTAYNFNPTVTASVANNGYLYLFFQLANEQSYQFCDEIAIDNINITGRNF